MLNYKDLLNKEDLEILALKKISKERFELPTFEGDVVEDEKVNFIKYIFDTYEVPLEYNGDQLKSWLKLSPVSRGSPKPKSDEYDTVNILLKYIKKLDPSIEDKGTIDIVNELNPDTDMKNNKFWEHCLITLGVKSDREVIHELQTRLPVESIPLLFPNLFRNGVDFHTRFESTITISNDLLTKLKKKILKKQKLILIK